MAGLNVKDVIGRRDARRYETFSVSLFPQEIDILDRIAETYGMGRSQAIRFVINDWQQMKREREQQLN